jgi:site-specific recombinase XerD
MQNNPTEAPDWRAEFHRLEGAYAAGTIRSYRGDIAVFEAWCAEEGIPPFPAEVDAVCRFLEDQGIEKAPATVRRRLYAIRKVHRLLRMPDPTHDEEINLSLRRVRRSKAIRPRQAKGLTRDLLDRFRDTQPETVIGLRNRAMLSVGYELLTRRSELVALRTDDLEDRGDGTFRVLIRRSKADQFGAGRIAFTSQKTADMVRAWLEVRGSEIDWLFCPVY